MKHHSEIMQFSCFLSFWYSSFIQNTNAGFVDFDNFG
jgi:hypothetical protein